MKQSNLTICPNCKSKMKRFGKTLCLECKNCDDIYHIDTLAFKNENQTFESNEKAEMFLNMVLREEGLL